jgi:phosphoribosyl 1,2-cyclic phosphate phosphodiesterase
VNNKELIIKFLGTGTSQGVPVIACNCSVCQSTDSKDKRLRSSILVNFNNENYVVDSGPDFRYQMLREKVNSLRGVLFTHEHKDHISGLDDVRAFNFSEGRDMQVYCSKEVELALKREFHYVFSDDKYPGIPRINITNIKSDSFELQGGLQVLPINVLHYKMPVKAYRFFDFTYITDAKTISKNEVEKIKGTKILVVNALRLEEHISHFNLKEALEFIKEINPEKAYLTHISHLFGRHTDIMKMLPDNVFPAYDGMEIKMRIY